MKVKTNRAVKEIQQEKFVCNMFDDGRCFDTIGDDVK